MATHDAIDPNLGKNNGYTFKYDGTGTYGARFGYIGSWGYWSHPAMSAAITKVQEVFEDDPSTEYVEEPPTEKSVMGLMDNGYFGIIYSPGYVRDPDTPYAFNVDSSYYSFYTINNDLHRTLGDDTYLISFALDGVTWSGDALGIAISSEPLMHMAPVARVSDVEVEVRAGERVECSLYVPADGATT